MDKITMTAILDDTIERPDSFSKKYESDAWQVTLRYDGRQMAIPYFTGTGHRKYVNGQWTKPAPTVSNVLGCLLSDAQGAGESFEEWCSELGYDTDSRRAEKIYIACKDIARRLRILLGDDYENFAEMDEDQITAALSAGR